MNITNRILFVCLLIGGLLVPRTAASLLVEQEASEQKPGLWTRAVAFMEQQPKRIPGKFLSRLEMIDRKGKVTEAFDQWYSLNRDEGGKYRQYLLKAVRNGIDVTERERKALLKSEAKKKQRAGDQNGFSYNWGDTPLNAAKQDLVQVSVGDERQTLFGRSCLRFDFVQMIERGKPEQLKGMAWIDEQSGCPVKIEFTRDPLPRFVKSFWSVYRFDAEPSGVWVLREMNMEGEGGLLVIKKHFRSTITFDEFQAYSDPEK